MSKLKDGKRVNLMLPQADLDAAATAHGGITAAVTRSLKVANFLDRALREGKTLLLRDGDGVMTEVEFV